MATVNRFFNPRAIAQVNPVPLEQLALVPQYMRQQHNAIEAAAFENTILQADTLSQDAQIARQALSPIEQQSEEIINGLAKTGFSQEKKSELMKLLSTKKQVERDIIQPLEARKQQYLASVEEIKTSLKDDPELMQNRLTQLNILNNEGARVDPDTGKLVVPSIENPMYAKRLSTQEMKDALDVNKLVPELVSEGYLNASDQAAILEKGADIWAVIESKKLSSKSQQAIYNTLRNTVQSDVVNSIKMDLAVQLGPVSDQISMADYVAAKGPDGVKAFEQEVDKILEYKEMFKLSKSEAYKNIQRPEGKKEYLDKKVAEYKNSERYSEDVANTSEQINNKSALNYLTDMALEDKLKGISETMSYVNQELDRKYLDMGATESLRADARKEQANIFLPTVPGASVNTGNLSPFKGMSLDKDYKGSNLRKSPARLQAEQTVLQNNGYSRNEEGNWVNPQGYTIDAKDFPRVVNRFESEIKSAVSKISNPETNKEFQTYVNNDKRLKEYQRQNGADKTLELVNNWFQNVGTTYNAIRVPEKSTRDRLKDIYSVSINNFKMIDQEGNELPFEDFVESNLDVEPGEAIDTGFEIVGPRNVPGQGTMIEVSFRNKDNESVNAFVEAPMDLTYQTQTSASIDRAIANMKESNLPYAKVEEPDMTNFDPNTGQIIPVYYTAIPDYQTGSITLLGSAEKNIAVQDYINVPSSELPDNIIKLDYKNILNREAKVVDKTIQQYTLQNKDNK